MVSINGIVNGKGKGLDMTSQNSDQQRGRTERSFSRRAILVTGAIASGTLAVGDVTGRSADRRGGKGAFPEGTLVVDGENPDSDPAIVIKSLDVPIRDWIVYSDETVAEHNPSYDPDDRVVIIAFVHLLEQGWPNWRRNPPYRLFDGVIERSIKFHAFPQARLERPRSTGRE